MTNCSARPRAGWSDSADRSGSRRFAGHRPRRYGPAGLASAGGQGFRVADIFDEVEAELKAERTQKLLVKYGGWLVGAAALVVALAAAWQVWQWYQLRYERATAAIYLDALFAAEQPADNGKAPGAKLAGEDFARVIQRGPASYRVLAQLQEAALAARSGDAAKAATLWDAVAGNGSADPLLRDLARLLAVQHQLDSGNPQALRDRLAPLLAPGNPWRSLARETEALLDLREGKADQAKKVLHELAQDVTAPQGVRERAGSLLQRLNG
jgi:hypothetical protein